MSWEKEDEGEQVKGKDTSGSEMRRCMKTVVEVKMLCLCLR